MKNFVKGFACMGVVCLLFITVSTNIYTNTINEQERVIIKLEKEKENFSKDKKVTSIDVEENK